MGSTIMMTPCFVWVLVLLVTLPSLIYSQLIFCAPLSPPANGLIGYDNNRRIFSNAQVTCQAGYQIIGNGSLFCNGNGRWVGSIPECRIIPFCAPLSPPANGFISYANNRRIFSNAQVTCQAGYQIIGNGSLFCIGNRTWVGRIPECRIIPVPGHPCGPLVQPVGGFIDFLGTVAADFFCKEGYEVRGVARLFCLHKPNSQMWSGPEPNCTRVPVCPELTKPEYGSLSVFTSQQMPIRAEFTCLPGASMSGDKVLHCQPDNTWSGVPAKCNGTGLFNANVTDGSPPPAGGDERLIIIIALGAFIAVFILLSIMLIICCRKRICMGSAAYKVESTAPQRVLQYATSCEQQFGRNRQMSAENLVDDEGHATASVI